jgi:endonuclease/exonuclease/phosphatase family metal-dependent hydrolase
MHEAPTSRRPRETTVHDDHDLNPRFGTLIETRLRVLTWNLWGRFGPWEARLGAIAATLATSEADVAALQEVWEAGERNQAAELASALGFSHAYTGRFTIDGVTIGNAVLSRWPIVDLESRMLPAPPELEELRVVSRAAIDAPRGPLQVYTTHLNWRFEQSAVRREQLRSIARFVAETTDDDGYPPILAGDMNATPDADEIRMLTGRTDPPVANLVFHDAWEAAGNTEPGFTWTNANRWATRDLEPDRRIDYVFVGWPRRGGAGHVTSCRLVGEPVNGLDPSDHLGVLASLRY